MFRPLCLAALLMPRLATAEADPSVSHGKTLFETNCRVCHGPTASTGRSGDIRGSDYYRVRKATGGIEQMPEFEITEDEIRAIVAYLGHLQDAR